MLVVGFLNFVYPFFNINDPCLKSSSGLSKRFLESGVKGVFIISLVPDAPKLYVNVKQVWINHDINHLKEYKVPTDLKLCILLHLLIGTVKKIYNTCEAIWLQSVDYLKACIVKKEEYDGGRFAEKDS